jgi:hypothetical protein
MEISWKCLLLVFLCVVFAFAYSFGSAAYANEPSGSSAGTAARANGPSDASAEHAATSIEPVAKSTVATSSGRTISSGDLAFLQGLWVGKTDEGDYAEEYWSAAAGDGFIGHCRFVKDGKTNFLEFLQIVKTPAGWVLRMRHYSGDMKPWAEEAEAGDCFLT